MPLNVGFLKENIARTFRQQLKNTGQIATEISNSYEQYTRVALGPNGDPILIKGSEKLAIKQAVENILKNRLLMPLAANILGLAVLRYWMLPPVMTGSGGTVTLVITPPGVSKLMATHVDNVDSAAQALAQSLHLITKTVFFVYPAPIPPGLII
jgi:hypothetical protein